MREHVGERSEAVGGHGVVVRTVRWFVFLLWGSLVAVGAGAVGASAITPTVQPGAKTIRTGEGAKTTALQRKIQKGLVGRWRLEDSEDELDFRRDGVFVGKTHAVEMTTRWEVTPDGQLAIEFGLPIARKAAPSTPGAAPAATPTVPATKILREVRFKKGTLILRDPATGQTYRYRRLR